MRLFRDRTLKGKFVCFFFFICFYFKAQDLIGLYISVFYINGGGGNCMGCFRHIKLAISVLKWMFNLAWNFK